MPTQFFSPPGAVGWVAYRRLVQLLQSNNPIVKLSRLPVAKVPGLSALAPDIEGMMTRLRAPATETPLPVKRPIQRAVAAILISRGSETGLFGAEQDAFPDHVERGNATAEDRRSARLSNASRRSIARLASGERYWTTRPSHSFQGRS